MHRINHEFKKINVLYEKGHDSRQVHALAPTRITSGILGITGMLNLTELRWSREVM